MFQPDPSNFLLNFVLLFTKLLMIKENLDMYLCYLQNTYLRITDRGTLSKIGYVFLKMVIVGVRSSELDGIYLNLLLETLCTSQGKKGFNCFSLKQSKQQGRLTCHWGFSTWVELNVKINQTLPSFRGSQITLFPRTQDKINARRFSTFYLTICIQLPFVLRYLCRCTSLCNRRFLYLSSGKIIIIKMQQCA